MTGIQTYKSSQNHIYKKKPKKYRNSLEGTLPIMNHQAITNLTLPGSKLPLSLCLSLYLSLSHIICK